jgi:hypothetical protein
MDAGQIVAGAVVGLEGGPWGAVAGGGGALIKVLVTQHIFNKAIAKGEESFVNFAAQYAVGE